MCSFPRFFAITLCGTLSSYCYFLRSDVSFSVSVQLPNLLPIKTNRVSPLLSSVATLPVYPTNYVVSRVSNTSRVWSHSITRAEVGIHSSARDNVKIVSENYAAQCTPGKGRGEGGGG